MTGAPVLECLELERREPRARAITGNIVMPGFTAPKLLWVARHEPEIFRRTASVLLPKDYVRLQLTGEKISDMSDAAGTSWLDVGRARLVRRDAGGHWSDSAPTCRSWSRATTPAGVLTASGRRTAEAAARPGRWRRRRQCRERRRAWA